MTTHNAATPLQRAAAAARSGDLPQARAIAEAALGQGLGDPVALHALLGMVHARSGATDLAVRHLRQAHDGAPGDVTIACNLIAVLSEQGEEVAALAVASEALAAKDPSLRIWRYRAFLAQRLECFDLAVAAYRALLARGGDEPDLWNNLGNALLGQGDATAAVVALETAVARDPTAAPIRLNLANALETAERDDEAEAVLRAALADFPQDPCPARQLYELCRERGRQVEALAALEEAARRDPADPALSLRLGVEYGIARRLSDAEAALRRTIALDPAGADAYVSLAIQFEHANRTEEFAPLLDQARANRIAPGALALIEAFQLRRAERFAEALARLDQVDPAIEPVRARHLRGSLLERLGRSDAAFAAFTASNQAMIAVAAEAMERAAALRADLRETLALLTPEWRDAWRPASVHADGRRDPVFLLGFPRSGTTLLDTMLMGHAQTVVMEEQPPLNIVEKAIGGLRALPDLSGADIAQARDRYFAEVAKLQPVQDHQLLIDKSPLFLFRLPLIRRLFPAARIILALRHPCDAVLSCYMANFQPNPAMANFLRLDDAAAFYDLCFAHWDRARALFPLATHTVVYEDLVADPAPQLRALSRFLGLPWQDAMLDHQATARSRGLITTASYAQVTEPLYARAAGRWERYRDHLAPVLPILAPWAIRLGYGDPRAIQQKMGPFC